VPSAVQPTPPPTSTSAPEDSGVPIDVIIILAMVAGVSLVLMPKTKP
jgi:hypothetical protein